ncbi:MAG: hypothetical protein AB1601_09755 [Planctomycetota bacterium]
MANSPIAALDNGFFLLLAMLCLVMLSVAMLRRSQQRQATAREVTREHMARLRDQHNLRGSMDDLLVQLEEVARRVNAQVDTRFAKLEAVIHDADQRIARLEQLTGHVTSRTTSPTGPAASPPPPDGDLAAPTPTTSAPPPTTSVPPRCPSTPPGERRRRIYDLADQGTSALVIADALQMPIGEVELILSLRKFK